MLKVSIFGASGYTGMELALLVHHHPEMELSGVYVSEHSQDANKLLAQLDARFYQPGFDEQNSCLIPACFDDLKVIAQQSDLIFLATPHEFSHNVAPILVDNDAKVLDLSGAFRLSDTQVFSSYYGFEHREQALLQQAVYGLAEWYAPQIRGASFVAVPGCYPTASLLALKPLQQAGLICSGSLPVINATSGVSGAGRKATMTNSLCEVSLQAYGVLGHRHQPEISQYLDNQVIFTPHLGNFKRGILATVTARLSAQATEAKIADAYEQAYADTSLVNLIGSWPKLDHVVGSPHCHIHWQYSSESGYIVVSSAIDNLLKGAASQAVQCANLMHGFDTALGLCGGLA